MQHFAFDRCLLEILKATEMRQLNGMPIVFRGGSYHLESDGSIHLRQIDSSMHDKLPYLIDISNSEATVASDKARIMSLIDQKVGIDKLNTKIRGIVLGASQSTGLSEGGRTVSSAACHDLEAISTVLANPLKYMSYAASFGYTNVLSKILELGVDADKSTGISWAPLHCAANGAHLDCITILLDHGANVDFQTEEGTTALIRVAYNGFEDCLQELCKRGASVNVTNHDGETALSSAISFKHRNCIDILLMNGAVPPGEEYSLNYMRELRTEVEHRNHIHKLIKQFAPIERNCIRSCDDIKFSFRCAVCDKIGINACYYCRDCRYIIHTACLQDTSVYI